MAEAATSGGRERRRRDPLGRARRRRSSSSRAGWSSSSTATASASAGRDDGPKAGYFPNIIGWHPDRSPAAGSPATTLLAWRALAGRSSSRATSSKPVLAMLLPTIVYVVADPVHRHLRRLRDLHRGLHAVAGQVPLAADGRSSSLGVPVALFLLFEIWFLVPLPKGPLERLLGYLTAATAPGSNSCRRHRQPDAGLRGRPDLEEPRCSC